MRNFEENLSVRKWPTEGLVLECKYCKEKNNDLSRVSCCACQIMSLEPDFIAQKGAVEELIKNAGLFPPNSIVN